MRYDTLEFSAAGLSLARSTVEASELALLQRGDECEATLCLGGRGWEESYGVVFRLAVRGPAHVGLAFVTLPPAARRLLAHASVVQEDEGPSFGGSPWGGRPAPFAFARLVEREVPARRLVLSTSEAVLALTQARHRKNGPRPKVAAVRTLPIPLSPGGVLVRESAALPPGMLLAYGIALLVVLGLFWSIAIA